MYVCVCVWENERFEFKRFCHKIFTFNGKIPVDFITTTSTSLVYIREFVYKYVYVCLI